MPYAAEFPERRGFTAAERVVPSAISAALHDERANQQAACFVTLILHGTASTPLPIVPFDAGVSEAEVEEKQRRQHRNLVCHLHLYLSRCRRADVSSRFVVSILHHNNSW